MASVYSKNKREGERKLRAKANQTQHVGAGQDGKQGVDCQKIRIGCQIKNMTLEKHTPMLRTVMLSCKHTYKTLRYILAGHSTNTHCAFKQKLHTLTSITKA